jgi:hypothetical protein
MGFHGMTGASQRNNRQAVGWPAEALQVLDLQVE